MVLGELKSGVEITFELKKNAKVVMTQLFIASAMDTININTTAIIDQDASFRIDDCILYNGELDLQDNYSLISEGANLYHRTLNISSEKDKISRRQTVVHQGQKTVSELENYLIAVNHAKLKYTVNGIIEKGNKKASCTQSNRGLIFGEHAEIEADPNLMIDEYDVYAAHGAAIGQVSEDELFYLQSRGLSEIQAKKLIVSGFVTPFLKSLSDPEIETYVNRYVEAKIKGANII
jgi:Fe-S cluster assembly protein SufD